MELSKDIPAPVSGAVPIEAGPKAPAALPVSARALIEEFSNRSFTWIQGWHKELGRIPVPGYQTSDLRADRRRLIRILDANNKKFEDKINLIEYGLDVTGYIEKCELPKNSPIFVRADLHSDLASLLAQLKMLKNEGYLDEDFHCKGDFHMIFLGDYGDKGGNDMEVLSLLLTLRMENEKNVHLLRGNHEDVAINKEYSSDRDFIERQETRFTRCYESFPVALCVGCEEKYRKPSGDQQRQYIHFSHALFSPSEDLSSFLQGNEGPTYLVQERLFYPEAAALGSRKALKAMNELRDMFRDLPEAYSPRGYMWNDIGPSSEISRIQFYQMSPHQIHLYLQGSKSPGAKIVSIFRGHQHELEEFAVPSKKRQRKIIATTLAVGIASGEHRRMPELYPQTLQGLILRVQPKGSEWTKQPVFLEPLPADTQPLIPEFSLSHETRKMFERIAVKPPTVDRGIDVG